MDSVCIQSKFIVAAPKRVLAPGQLVLQNGKIMAVLDSGQFERPDLNLSDSVLAPGLINAHTHLEFSLLEKPFPAGGSFPSWISTVVAHRRELVNSKSKQDLSHCQRRALLQGLVESYQSGTCLLADICSMPWGPDWLPTVCEFSGELSAAHSHADVPSSQNYRQVLQHLPNLPMQVIALPEVIGLTSERYAESLDWAESLIAADLKHEFLHSVGISPHAPYSVPGPALLCLIQHRSEAIRRARLVAMHLAESRDEVQWLAQGSGAFYDNFSRLGIPTDVARPSLDSILELLADQPRALVIHGNYLSRDQHRMIARHPAMSIVYCPRTHAHFGHDSYPLESLMNAGCRLVLGTDSRASNPDLNLWSEVVGARHAHPQLSPALAFASVTCNAATALGLEQDFGSLEPGKLANLICAPCQADWTEKNLLDRLTSQDTQWSPLVSELSLVT